MRLRQPPYASVLTTQRRASIVATATDEIYLQMFLLLEKSGSSYLYLWFSFSLSFAFFGSMDCKTYSLLRAWPFTYYT